MRILLPKTFTEVDFDHGPFFFLAGPVRGGGDWQARAVQLIRSYVPQFTAALPCRYPETHPLMAHKQPGIEGHFDRQLAWERYYLRLAARRGCLLFWLGAESKEFPRGNGEPYGMETMGELGEWRGQMMYDHDLKVVIGGDAGFAGIKQVQANFNRALRADFPIWETLEETVIEAIAKAQMK